MNPTILEITLSVFLLALVITVIFRKLHLSVILGYLLVGACVGPHALGLVPDSPRISELAEFGIVFLMFTVGLEFSIPKLFALRVPVFFVGFLQVTLSILTTCLAGMFLGLSFPAAMVIGSIVAMSSTAIVVKQLHDQYELHSAMGFNAIGILLFQDLAVIPVIILTASFATHAEFNIGLILLRAIAKGLFAILFIYVIGRWLLRPIFHFIAKTRAIELFTLTVLFVTLTAAWLTHTLGLSFALGAFLAGIMLAETEFRHQIEVEIRPFRDLLLGLFFITIGMLADIKNWYESWQWILLLLSAIVIGKMVLITLISYLGRISLATSLRTGLVLAQGGEFGFAILTLALNKDILPPEYGQVVLAALVLSIIISPFLIHFNKTIAETILPESTKQDEQLVEQTISTLSKKLQNHVIICGYGRVGQQIARILDKLNIPYLGLDLDSELVERASLAGDNVIYGDASHPEILRAAGIKHARVLVISLSDTNAGAKILTMAKQKYPKMPILVRCRDEAELKQLKELGPTMVIAELYEASLSIAYHLLHFLKLPRSRIAKVIQDVRNSDYNLLQKVFTGTEEALDPEESSFYEQLRPIVVHKGDYAVNRTFDELDLESTGVEVVSIRHENAKQLKPNGKTKIHANDIVVMHGSLEELELAENKLLNGP